MGKGRNNGRRPQKRAQPSWQRHTDEPDDFAPFASWDGDDFGRVYGDPDDEPEDTRRATVVIPAITLPTMPSVQPPPGPRPDGYDDHDGYDGYDGGYKEKPQRGLVRRPREPMSVEPAPAPTRQNRAIVPVSKKPKVPPGVDVVLVPGNETSRSGVRHTARPASRRLAAPLHIIRTHRKALTIFALAIILAGVL